MRHGLVALATVALICSACAAAELYVKRATPAETLNASLAAYHQRLPKGGKWYILGPFDHEDKTFAASKPIDLGAVSKGMGGAEIRWVEIWKVMDRRRPHDMNQFIKPRHVAPCAVYTWRSLDSPVARTWDVKIVFSNTLTAWLNREQIAFHENKRRSYRAAARIRLALKKGQNELVLRLDTNHYRRVQSCLYPAVSEEDFRREVVSRMRKDFPELPLAWIEEFNLLQSQLNERRPRDRRYRQRQALLASQALRKDALLWDSDRDPLDVVLRRTAALLRHLQREFDVPSLAAEAARLAEIQEENTAASLDDVATRWNLFVRARGLRRRIALANPLLNFDNIVFIKRHRARFQHMCDQYFGFHANPGGGVYVLSDCFGKRPTVRDVLKDAEVQAGRFKGKRLEPGSFIALDLSYDAKTILFAYTEAAATRYRWSPQSTYHVFKANVDGTGLVQLTDGAWNDFDPCWLPDGRIAFISERRGGFGRCHGRPVPTYTLHSMRADGSDIARLSLHETNEWHPSVDHHGMIVYTRWDYVDRDSDIAHHIWLTYPDGRDPRSYHGNYPVRRQSRPWMEMSIRAVPSSPRYIGVAAAHHGQAYGSLVLIDHRLEDDDSMSQLKRVTPEAPFPESEIHPGGQLYGTPWPLSEDYYLCVYCPEGRRYGIYLVDSFGSRELIYRDPKIACLDPIPLRTRRRPPVIPALTRQALSSRKSGRDSKGVIAVINVYDGDFEWPKRVKIAALRVVQLFPKATPSSSRPMIGAGAQSLARGVLGTVPVERDGSVHFEAPANVPIYFQALDERGLAVQSMRSDTYVHPGERLVCQGCHEHKRRPPSRRQTSALALRRPPSRIRPDVDGSYPLLYPRLVQPVLDRRCGPCHGQHKKAPDLGREDSGRYGWSKSFVALSPYGYALHGGNGAINRRSGGGSRSVAGKVGALASKLFRMIEAGHHDVKLSPEDLHRITLWLDCNTNFYGAYRDTRAQARGEVVMPKLR